jgi:hypothetical protein
MGRTERIFAFSIGLGVLIIGYTNASPPGEAIARAKQTVKDAIPGTEFQKGQSAAEESAEPEQPRYVKIEGKLYEWNPRGYYLVDGVPTYNNAGLLRPKKKKAMVADAKLAQESAAAGSAKGPIVDPSIYKEQIGTDEQDLLRNAEDQEIAD